MRKKRCVRYGSWLKLRPHPTKIEWRILLERGSLEIRKQAALSLIDRADLTPQDVCAIVVHAPVTIGDAAIIKRLKEGVASREEIKQRLPRFNSPHRQAILARAMSLSPESH